ncbi:MAG: Asp-tRNA(Asn)/Glu-tRNA(Gln) amidotransferase subunit GatB [Candidatus Sungiibacteriota bacterium]|uniref:Aspartyl/glutamyl-tRNA(Asn/Gln) amidotransferase subunit B n=1 Tax=Candidatus Sungiibacteriota bacterium TaxID=2750080 RepID=A0A7T5UQW4_9BACT|nr:MAG: Asp-tRNA(Asn)/Glu-tRNA(Gln) amidotransferase subunit GatB [Candidatus Sungbacteria bacterium]
MKYEAVIGLEIHAELKTKTKMFCYSLNDPNEKHPNINICPICMGHPGTLPVINEEAVKKVRTVGLALGGDTPEFSQFDRKNYFYPDLPKGYQISQYQYPLVTGGHLEIDGKKFRIRRVHLEEDTGRLIHDTKTGSSLVDFNRAGVPLMELVTEPDFRSGEEVRKFGEELQRILRYLGVSDADMEKGQMRVEVNISMHQQDAELGIKVEIKNINSFKFAADAVDYEIERQTEFLEKGEKIKQETRGWNENKHETFPQRSKEEAHDYRYFPEPDLPPLKISSGEIEKLRLLLPELPAARRERFAKEYGLERDMIEILTRDKAFADYLEEVISELRQHDVETPEKPRKNLEKLAAAFLTGDFLRILRKSAASVFDTRISPENFAELVSYVAEDKISNLAAKQVLEEMFSSGEDPSDIIEKLGLWQLSAVSDLEDIARHILEENPQAVEDYKKGTGASLQFLVGQVMRESRGKANPKIVQEVLKKLL